MTQQIAYSGTTIFDGHKRQNQSALLVERGSITGIVPDTDIPADCKIVPLDGGLITAGFVDLQVNGGGGKMLNNTPDVDTIQTICKAHLQFGTTSLLPTLITDTKEITDAAIAAARHALAQNIEGMIGLHLEGPHLSIAKKGAHDPALIRVMEGADCDQLAVLAKELPSLLLTVAPESVTNAQIKTLADAGATISLGHSDAGCQTAIDAVNNGARCVTHLFNAMRGISGGDAGVVGAALETGHLFAGLIADGIHVSAASIRIALRAKTGPGKIFLVTDAMATIGTDIRVFTLNGRRIFRRNGRLNLSDGTLAGADLNMISAVRFMINTVGLDADESLRMASLYPAQLIKRDTEIGRLARGAKADFLHLSHSYDIISIWQGGVKQR